MKKINLNLSSTLAALLLVLSFLMPFMANYLNIKSNIFLLLVNCYIIAYLSYLISFMDTKKVLAMLTPLAFYTIILTLIMRGFRLNLNIRILNDIYYVITNLFDVIFVVFVFFVLEIILKRIFGSVFTNIIAILSLILYLVLHNTKIIAFDVYYKDLFLYFAFYVMASRIRPATKLNPILYILAIILIIGEIYITYKYDYYLGIYFSIFLFTYLVLKDTSQIEEMNFSKYLVFIYLYPYKLIFVIIGQYINRDSFIVVLISVLISFILGEALYKLKFKTLNYLLLGIH